VFERVRSFRRLLSNSNAAEGHIASSGSSGRRHRDWNNVRLFQVLPPSLTGRVHVWHNQLNIKDGWRPYDMPYFDAVRCLLFTCVACITCKARPPANQAGSLTHKLSGVCGDAK
jgi:hypothetical protein